MRSSVPQALSPAQERLRRKLLHGDRRYWQMPLQWWLSGREASAARETLAQIETYAMFLGYPRSGHTLIGSLLNAHPEAVIAHELNVLRYVQWRFSRDRIFALLLRRDREFGRIDRRWSGYDYRIQGLSQGDWNRLRVIGDKRGGATTRLLHRRPYLLDRLRATLDLPLRVFHHVRNPYDNIARMAMVSGADLSHAMDRYFRNVAWATETISRLESAEIMHVYHEQLTADPKATLQALLGHLGLTGDPEYLEIAAGYVMPTPRRSRERFDWPQALVDDVQHRIAAYPHLAGYRFDS